MCPAVFVSSPSQRKAVSGLVENSGKDTDAVVFTPQFISLLLINGYLYSKLAVLAMKATLEVQKAGFAC